MKRDAIIAFVALHVLLLKLQLFARWGSATILRYVREAPLACLTSDILARNAPSSSAAGASRPGPGPRRGVNFDEGFVKAKKDIELLKKEVARLTATESAPEFLLNIGTRVCHRILCGDVAAPSCTWRTACGFFFGAIPRVRLKAPDPKARQCRSCTHLVADPPPDEDSSSSSDSSAGREPDL